MHPIIWVNDVQYKIESGRSFHEHELDLAKAYREDRAKYYDLTLITLENEGGLCTPRKYYVDLCKKITEEQ